MCLIKIISLLAQIILGNAIYSINFLKNDNV